MSAPPKKYVDILCVIANFASERDCQQQSADVQGLYEEAQQKIAQRRSTITLWSEEDVQEFFQHGVDLDPGKWKALQQLFTGSPLENSDFYRALQTAATNTRVPTNSGLPAAAETRYISAEGLETALQDLANTITNFDTIFPSNAASMRPRLLQPERTPAARVQRDGVAQAETPNQPRPAAAIRPVAADVVGQQRRHTAKAEKEAELNRRLLAALPYQQRPWWKRIEDAKPVALTNNLPAFQNAFVQTLLDRMSDTSFLCLAHDLAMRHRVIQTEMTQKVDDVRTILSAVSATTSEEAAVRMKGPPSRKAWFAHMCCTDNDMLDNSSEYALPYNDSTCVFFSPNSEFGNFTDAWSSAMVLPRMNEDDIRRCRHITAELLRYVLSYAKRQFGYIVPPPENMTALTKFRELPSVADEWNKLQSYFEEHRIRQTAEQLFVIVRQQNIEDGVQGKQQLVQATILGTSLADDFFQSGTLSAYPLALTMKNDGKSEVVAPWPYICFSSMASLAITRKYLPKTSMFHSNFVPRVERALDSVLFNAPLVYIQEHIGACFANSGFSYARSRVLIESVSQAQFTFPKEECKWTAPTPQVTTLMSFIEDELRTAKTTWNAYMRHRFENVLRTLFQSQKDNRFNVVAYISTRVRPWYAFMYGDNEREAKMMCTIELDPNDYNRIGQKGNTRIITLPLKIGSDETAIESAAPNDTERRLYVLLGSTMNNYVSRTNMLCFGLYAVVKTLVPNQVTVYWLPGRYYEEVARALNVPV